MVTGVIVLAAVLAAAGAFGMIWKTRSGRLRPGPAATADGGGPPAPSGGPPAPSGGPPAPSGGPPGPGGQALTGAELGRPLGGRATLVQFSSAFCAPCRATRVILADVAGQVQGVAHVEIDAGGRPDLVRRLDIRRTPTVLVLGPDGRIARRGSGQPRKADIIAALGEVIPGQLAPGEVS